MFGWRRTGGPYERLSLTNEPLLVDTSYWIEHFNRPGTDGARAVEALIREDRAALAGVILAEHFKEREPQKSFPSCVQRWQR
jgi:hypothetical protein